MKVDLHDASISFGNNTRDASEFFDIVDIDWLCK